MDYASPLSNELVFSMAVERLLDIEVPERRHVDPHDAGRAQPHVVAPALPGHQRHGPRRGLDDDLRLARARAHAAAARDHHRPADEPQLHPARRRRRRPPRRLAGRRRSSCASRSRPASPSTTRCSPRTRSGASAPSASGSSPPRRRSRSAPPGRSCAPPGSPGTCARRSRTSRTTRSTST